MTEPKVATTIHLPLPLWQRLDAYREATGIARDKTLREALTAYLDAKEKTPSK